MTHSVYDLNPPIFQTPVLNSAHDGQPESARTLRRQNRKGTFRRANPEYGDAEPLISSTAVSADYRVS